MQSAKQDRFLNQEKGSTMGWYSRSWRSRDGRETGIGKERKGDGEGRVEAKLVECGESIWYKEYKV